jgi:hypothetical protein
MLKDFTFWNSNFKMQFGADASDVIGRYSRSLDSIEFSCSTLNLQQFANGVEANVFGPNKIILNCAQVDEELQLSSIIAPLLNNPRLKILHLDFSQSATTLGNLEVIKAALQCNNSLEELFIECYPSMYIELANQLKLLSQGLASAPKLRTLSLKLDGPRNGLVSSQELSEMFADALKECQNSSL